MEIKRVQGDVVATKRMYANAKRGYRPRWVDFALICLPGEKRSKGLSRTRWSA